MRGPQARQDLFCCVSFPNMPLSSFWEGLLGIVVCSALLGDVILTRDYRAPQLAAVPMLQTGIYLIWKWVGLLFVIVFLS